MLNSLDKRQERETKTRREANSRRWLQNNPRERVAGREPFLEFFNLIDRFTIQAKRCHSRCVQFEKFLKMIIKELNIDELPINAFSAGFNKHALQ